MRKLTLTGPFLALLLTSTALASAALFPTNVRIETTVSLVAGKPAHVLCYNSDSDWNYRVQTAFSGHYTGAQIRAFTYAGSSVTEVSPAICRTAYYALRVGYANVNLARLGAVIDVFSHEPNHMTGLTNEAQTEACAKRYFAFVAHALLGVKYHTTSMRRIVNSALSYSATLDPNYQGGSCPR